MKGGKIHLEYAFFLIDLCAECDRDKHISKVIFPKVNQQKEEKNTIK